MTDQQRAIWRRMTDEQRQRVIDAVWFVTTHGRTTTWFAKYEFEECCPLGLALEAKPCRSPHPNVVADHFPIEVWEEVRAEAGVFVAAWDRMAIPPDDLVANLRQMQGAA